MRDEIWSIFGRKRPAAYFDDDEDSDMEAGADEVLREEMRTAKEAKREDAEEERKLEQARLAKKRRREAVAIAA
jgi:protein SPT2